jgi:hypothetical protein
MKNYPPLVALLAALLLTSGCATRTTASGGRETHVLGGAVSVATNSFQPVTPATVNTDVSNITGRRDPSGTKVSLFWGLLTFHDY